MKKTACKLAGVATGLAMVRVAFGVTPAVKCPSSCTNLFGRLDDDGVQVTEVQLRGEPKSGTGSTASWARRGLVEACTYLQTLYGEPSCRVEEDKRNLKFVFKPTLTPGDDSAPCACGNVKRVEIGASNYQKHSFPVDDECIFRHKNGVSEARDVDDVCRRADGLSVETGADLWRCVEEAECTLNDDRLQLAVTRDPRAITVSAFFYRLRKNPHHLDDFDFSIDKYFQEFLQITCMWIGIRHVLFTKLLGAQSKQFVFEDMLHDPVDWYGSLFSFIGLNLPSEVTLSAARQANAAAERGINEHPGGREAGTKQTFRDELGPESLAMMDNVMRLWLPPNLLQSFGVQPETST